MENEPVVSASVIAGAISAVLVALVTLGVIDLNEDQQMAIMAAVAAVLPILAAIWARAQVTPLSSPRDDDNEPLVRIDGTPALKARGK